LGFRINQHVLVGQLLRVGLREALDHRLAEASCVKQGLVTAELTDGLEQLVGTLSQLASQLFVPLEHQFNLSSHFEISLAFCLDLRVSVGATAPTLGED